MIEYLLLLLIPVMSWLDHQRGTPKGLEIIPKILALILMGYACAVLTGHWLDWQAAVITAGFAVLHNFSLGQPLGEALTGKIGQADDGSSYETWQVGPLKNCWLALSARGAVLGLAGFIALDLTAGLQIAVAWAVAFPLSAALVRYVRSLRFKGGGWGLSEYLRGFIASLILVSVAGFLG